jgi:hypothetical protein
MSEPNESNKDPLVKNFQLQCDTCDGTINVPIRKSNIDSTIGGVFKMVAIHQCEGGKQKAFVLFFDRHLALRSKAISDVAVSDIEAAIPLEEQILTEGDLFSTLQLLYEEFNKKLGSLIYGVLLGQQIIIVGEQEKVEPIINTLSIFAPHRQLTIHSWTEETSSADIMGKATLAKHELFEGIIIDLEKSEVINGYDNKFCSNLATKIGKGKDATSTLTMIEKEIEKVINYVHSYSQVTDLDEAEAYFTALAIDGVSEELLEIILPLSAEINPFIANYHKKDQLKLSKKTQLLPTHMWYFIDNQMLGRLKGMSKEQFFFKERVIHQKIKRVIKYNCKGEEFFEYITPSNRFFYLFAPQKRFIVRFPMITKGNTGFEQVIKIKHLNSPHIKETHLLDYFNVQLQKNNLDISNFSNEEEALIELHKTRPILAEHRLVERHYITNKVGNVDLKRIVREIIKLMTQKFPMLQPKIIRKENTITITETITNLSANENNPNEKVDLCFNVVLFNSSKRENRGPIILLELYLEPSFYKIGFVYDQAFITSYNNLMGIIREVVEL